MTLNTFHFAGRGEANVTMGSSSTTRATHGGEQKADITGDDHALRKDKMAKKYADTLASRLRKVTFAELVQDLSRARRGCTQTRRLMAVKRACAK